MTLRCNLLHLKIIWMSLLFSFFSRFKPVLVFYWIKPLPPWIWWPFFGHNVSVNKQCIAVQYLTWSHLATDLWTAFVWHKFQRSCPIFGCLYKQEWQILEWRQTSDVVKFLIVSFKCWSTHYYTCWFSSFFFTVNKSFNVFNFEISFMKQ